MKTNKLLINILFVLECLVIIFAVYYIGTKQYDKAVFDIVIAIYYNILRNQLEERDRRKIERMKNLLKDLEKRK